MAELGVHLEGRNLREQPIGISANAGIGRQPSVNGAVAALEQFANAKRDRVLYVFDGRQIVGFSQPGIASLDR